MLLVPPKMKFLSIQILFPTGMLWKAVSYLAQGDLFDLFLKKVQLPKKPLR